MKINELLEKRNIVEGDFTTLDKFDFNGVYLLYDSESNEVVYIGSAYARTIKDRLSQYLKANDSGNSLINSICKSNYGIKKIDEITAVHKAKALKIIKSFKIKAIYHNDLEYQLIKEAKPKYNKTGI